LPTWSAQVKNKQISVASQRTWWE